MEDDVDLLSGRRCRIGLESSSLTASPYVAGGDLVLIGGGRRLGGDDDPPEVGLPLLEFIAGAI